jgi:L-asparagine transporter-like permease
MRWPLRRTACSPGRSAPVASCRPAFGIISSTVLASIAMVLSYLDPPATVFNTLVFMSGATAAIPYGFSALAQIKWRIADNRPCTRPGSSATSASP